MPFELLTSDFYGFENSLTDREKALIVELRAFLETEVRPDHERAVGAGGVLPRSIVTGWRSSGCSDRRGSRRRRFPTRPMFRGWVALELARVDASVATLVGMQNGLVMGSIAVAGSDEQRAKWLPRFASGELLGAFALTEPLSGSDTAQGLRTVAKRDGDNWVINGAKRWIGNGSISDVTIVWAGTRRTTRSRASSSRHPRPAIRRSASRASRRCGSFRTPTSC